MKRIKTVLAGAVVFVFAGQALAADAKGKKEKLIKRGEYLVSTAGCHDCHTPKMMTDEGPVPDPKLSLSGSPANAKLPAAPKLAAGPWMILASGDLTAWNGPWGTSFARNLTPDKETGLGEWTEQNFLDTIKTGKRLGKGRAILPPMPWQVVRMMTDDDLKAVFAYLQSIPAVSNAVREPEPPAQAAVAPAAGTGAASTK